jgi:hypothetical protein
MRRQELALAAAAAAILTETVTESTESGDHSVTYRITAMLDGQPDPAKPQHRRTPASDGRDEPVSSSADAEPAFL